MSGRSLHLRDGELITNRKTDRRQSKSVPPHEMPDWRVTMPLPRNLAFSVSSDMPTGVIGVVVKSTPLGPAIEARGKDCHWLFGQAAMFLARIAKGVFQGRIALRIERDGYPGPTESGPGRPAIDRTQEAYLITEPSFVIPRGHQEPLIIPVKG